MKKKEPRFLVLLRGANEKDVYIMASDEGKIHGFITEDEANKYFLRAYEEKHSQSFEGSMSACVHFIQFQPRVVGFEDLEDIKRRIASDPPRLVLMVGQAGGLNAITCRPEAYEIWNKAESVPLISNMDGGIS